MAGPWEDFKPAPAADKSGPWDDFKINPTGGTVDNLRAGAGKAMVDAVRGGVQLAGDFLTSNPLYSAMLPDKAREVLARNNADIEESRRLDAPLMGTKAGTIGNLAGNVALTLAAPQATTATGAAAVGGILGALQPVAKDESRAVNTAAGAAAGAGAMKLGEFLRNFIGAKLANANQAAAARQAMNAEKDAALQAARDAGYVLPPSRINPSWINNRLEGIAGKAASGQESALRNQEVTNALARKALGLADDAPLSSAQLEKLAGPHRAVYDEVAKLSPDAAEAVQLWRQANFNKNAYWKFFNRSADPSAQEKAMAAGQASKDWFNFLTQEAKNAGRPDLVKELASARVALGKIGTVERALSEEGNVVAKHVKGGALTDELALIKSFAQGAGNKFVTEGSKVPSPGVSKVEGVMGAMLGAGTAAAMGPGGLAAGALPLLSHPVRSLILSPTYQRLVQPDYAVPATLRASNAVLASPALRALLPGLGAAGVIPQVQQ